MEPVEEPFQTSNKILGDPLIMSGLILAVLFFALLIEAFHLKANWVPVFVMVIAIPLGFVVSRVGMGSNAAHAELDAAEARLAAAHAAKPVTVIGGPAPVDQSHLPDAVIIDLRDHINANK